ncbi:amino acid ABC transporter ATP-binding protein [Halodesulfurarchaeum sp.]|uniref:amino acid ABC transporter ATP-binding protein n=1 Tax=Halodesulfurarchaeum sp. TaxID=1980530 RepID=UPI002FC2D490
MSDPLLQIDHLEKSYGDEDVLHDVSFEMAEGDAFVLIGPSGSGKSTLLRCVNRLTEPDSGNIYLDGTLTSGSEYDVDELRREVGMVFQDINLFAHLTAVENVTLGLEKVAGLDAEGAESRAMAELEQVGLADQAGSYPAELSGGQQQRVGIARALAMDPKLVLFDEPTSSLDPELTGEVVEVMQQLAHEGMTMLVVTHEMGFARSAATQMLFLEDGRLVEQGPPKQLFTDSETDRTQEFLRRITEAESAGSF